MRLFDLTIPLSAATPAYPGNPPFFLEPIKRLAQGHSSNVTGIRLGTHTGTHVDAPRHFFDGGRAADELPLDVLVGPARVVAVPGPRRGIGEADLAGAVAEGDTRVLIATGNSALWGSPEFHPDFAFLEEDGARFLLSRGVRLVGIDYLSIEQFKRPGAPVHHLLLDAGVVIVEGLNLAGVPPGTYELFCLPLSIVGADGAPARVVLRAET